MGNGDQAEGPGAFYPGGCLIGISTHIGDETVMATTTAQIQQLYVAYLGRAADKAGLDYWSQQLNAVPATLTLESLRANFVNEQPEYTAAYAGLTRSETVSKIYLQLFGHSADAAGLAYWTTGGGATVNADQLLQAFVNGASAADAKVVANKVLVAEVYTSVAGANYTQADAASVISEVDGSAASVTTALGHLSDGSLGGIATTEGIATLKADAIADAAVLSYEASKVASLKALNDKIVALDKGYDSGLTAIADGSDAGTVAGDSYSEVVVAIANATKLRNEIGGSTAQLQLDAKTASDKLADARQALVDTKPTAVSDINKYNAAVKADAAVTGPTQTKIDTDTAALQGVIGEALSPNAVAFKAASDAYVTAGGAAIADADALFDAITKASPAKLAEIDKAFNTGVFASTYANVKADGVAQAAKDVTVNALKAAQVAIGGANGDYVKASVANDAAVKVVADAQAADALVAEAKAETTAHKAITDVAVETQKAVNALNLSHGHDLDASTPNLVGDDAKADLFYFSAIKGTDDFTITDFNKGDALYIGEGYSLTSGVTTATDGSYVGTNASAKEVFFLQDKTTGVVSAVIETNAVGHAAGGSDTNVAIITLAGVTSLTDVSFANGVITSNHVAVA